MDELEENQAQRTRGDLFWIAGLVLPKQKDFFTPRQPILKGRTKAILVTHAQEYSQIIHLCEAEQECSFGLTNGPTVPTSCGT